MSVPKMALFLILILVYQLVQGNEVLICPTKNECTTLADIIEHPKTNFTSNTRLILLPGTHILQCHHPIIISGVSNFSLVGEGEIEEGFHWTVKQSNVVIECKYTNGGIVFNESSVSIIGITFTGCGALLPRRKYNEKHLLSAYDSGLYSDSYNMTIYSQLGAALFFINSLEVNLSQISIQNCSGSCLFFLNSEHITMNDLSISHNSPDAFSQLGCCNATIKDKPACFGANALFFYLDSSECKNKKTQEYTLVIKNSAFSFGAGSGTTGTTTLAGITIFDLIVANLTATFESVLLFDNAGGNFGVISSYSKFKMTNVTSYGANKYLLKACPNTLVGISFKFSISNEIRCPPVLVDGKCETIARLEIQDSKFEENTAMNSAGINIDTNLVVDSMNTVSRLVFSVENSTILKNHAPIASCIGIGGLVGYPARVKVKLVNLLMTRNYYYLKNNQSSAYFGIPPSCIVVINSQPVTFDNISITNQGLVGLFGFSSTLIFSGKNQFKNNTNNYRNYGNYGNGGGIAMYENSELVLKKDSSINFTDNRARRGAGIYVHHPQVTVRVPQHCVFKFKGFQSNPSSVMYFDGNNASETGNNVYGGNLEACRLGNQRLSPMRIRQYLRVLFNQTGNDSNTYYEFSSEAEKVCFCNNSIPVCDKQMYNSSEVFPGQSFNISIATIGQLEGFTTGEISVKASMLNFSHNFFNNKAECFNVSLPVRVEGNSRINTTTFVDFNISLESEQKLETSSIILSSVMVKMCPPGFTVNSSFVCQCNELLEKYRGSINLTCDIISVTISHDTSLWVGYDNDTNSTIVSKPCPFDYCIHDRVTYNIFDEAKQCAFHRSGVLCGECADGYSLLLGSNECGECPNDNFLSLLLVFGVAGILLVILIIVLNLTVSVGTINGIIFYANVVQMNQSDFFPKGPIILSQFISLINLDFGFETCFYKGMTPYAKVWLQYIFPVYIWVIVLIIIVFSRYSTRLSKLVGSSTIPALATLLLLSYSKVVKTFFLSLSLSKLYFEDGRSSFVWSVDGSLEYVGKKHMILLIVSLILFVLVIVPFTLFVTFAPLLEHYHVLSKFCPNLHCGYIKEVSDAYSDPFIDIHGYWLGIELVARLIMFIGASFAGDKQLLIVFFTLLLMISWLAIVGGVFRLRARAHKVEQRAKNFLQILSYVNLLALTLLALGDSTHIYICAIVSVSLMLATFILVFIFHLGWWIKKLVPFSSCINRFPRIGRRSKERVNVNQSSRSMGERKISDDLHVFSITNCHDYLKSSNVTYVSTSYPM